MKLWKNVENSVLPCKIAIFFKLPVVDCGKLLKNK